MSELDMIEADRQDTTFCPNCGKEFIDEEGVSCTNGEDVCSQDCADEYDE